MNPALARFAETLRAEGLSASPSELLDAARAIDAVGIEDRARVRAVLRATLAKDRRAVAILDRVFDAFFVPPEGAVGDRKGERRGTGRPDPRTTRRRPPDPDRRGGRKPAAERREDPREKVRRTLEALRERRRSRAPVRRRERGDATDPLHRALSPRASEQEDRELARMLPRIVEAIRLRASRRTREARRGRLDVRLVFRRNLRHQGIPFELPWRRPRPRPTRVVLLVDVSWSVARAAGYFLWIASEFLEPGRRARIVAFVDRPVDATEAVARWKRSSRATFAQVLQGLSGLNLDAASDYGRALHALASSKLRPAGRDTILVVLGDARTNRYDPLDWALGDLARRCRAVLWLVPEPESRWGTADSALAAYLPHVDAVAEATDLAGLARGVESVLRRL
ncbi:MAG TPA: VWA domain-containing protein [Candidatus Polarisedimenticolaceae bacterium]